MFRDKNFFTLQLSELMYSGHYPDLQKSGYLGQSYKKRICYEIKIPLHSYFNPLYSDEALM